MVAAVYAGDGGVMWSCNMGRSHCLRVKLTRPIMCSLYTVRESMTLRSQRMPERRAGFKNKTF